MTRSRISENFLLVLGGFLLVQGLLMHTLSPGTRCDLDILLEAGARFLSGQPIYALTDLNEHTKPPLLSPLLALLASVPREPLRLIGDTINVMLPLVAAALWWRVVDPAAPLRTRSFWTAAAGGLVLLRGFWRAEMDLAQYNLVVLCLTIAAFLAAREARLWSAGALAALGLLLKPTQIFFLPWIAAAVPKPSGGKLLRIFGGGVLLAIVLAAVHMVLRPPGELLQSHLDWLRFLPQSTAKHILRQNNFGLPSVLARQGWMGASSPALTLAGAVGLVLLSKNWKRPSAGLFHAAAWASVALSPMTWHQNFVVLFPLAFSLVVRIFSEPRRPWPWVAAVSLFIPNAVKPALLPPDAYSLWYAVSIPLLLALAAVGIELRELRLRKEFGRA